MVATYGTPRKMDVAFIQVSILRASRSLPRGAQGSAQVSKRSPSGGLDSRSKAVALKGATRDARLPVAHVPEKYFERSVDPLASGRHRGALRVGMMYVTTLVIRLPTLVWSSMEAGHQFDIVAPSGRSSTA